MVCRFAFDDSHEGPIIRSAKTAQALMPRSQLADFL
jgi:hypothetical protein